MEDFRLIPGAVEGMVRLAHCGYALIVASNQRGIARGLVTQALLRDTERALQSALAPHRVAVSGFYYCPHEIGDPGCDCRKPLPGMLRRAAKELELDLGASWVIGDSFSDIEAGVAAGTRTAYVGSGKAPDGPDLSADSLRAAAAKICGRG
jgi:D-glycero-D-manno-heptose 1,7-bisphosphate phosphatase